MTSVFATPIARNGEDLIGPWRGPRQMLADQGYDNHASIHDDATAQKLGFKGGTIEGPTHFSQFAPLAHAIWGRAWLETGCISAQYRAAVYDGEKVRAHLRPDGAQSAVIWMEKEDGTEVLRGTASIGPNHPPSALDSRLAALPPLADPVILASTNVGATSPRQTITMGFDQHLGALYPFTLAQKLKVITEPSPLYEGGAERPVELGRPIIPMEMISVLAAYAATSRSLYDIGSAVGLFSDQEIRLLDGPLHVGETYEMDREVVKLTGSRRTESVWVLTRIYRPGGSNPLATMLLNMALMKESVADYEARREQLYGKA